MPDYIIGAIMMFGGNFAPREYAICSGQTVAISDNPALFAVLSNTYGGDGRTTFQLPDCRGRVPIGFGRGLGLSSTWRQGEMFGTNTVTLDNSNLPSHGHVAVVDITNSGSSQAIVKCYAGDPGSTGVSVFGNPQGKYWGPVGGGNTIEAYYETATQGATMAADAVEVSLGNMTGTIEIGEAGGDEPFSIIQPVQVASYIIALVGNFPIRN